MLRITIDLVPYGVESNKKTLSQFEIVNTGKREDSLDIYIVRESAANPKPIVEFKHHRPAGLNVCVERALMALVMAGVDKIPV